jgi:AAHS family 4-hydroxybenzoate transporter-like MFS transporter
MSQEHVIDVSQIIDERKVDWFNIQLVIWGFFVVLFDGYDIGAAAFAAPALIKDWHLANRAALGIMFSASLFGILFGSAIFGYIGDRFGRKIAVISSLLTFGIFTWLAVLSSNLEQLSILRFFAGVGIGGLLPNIITFNAEFAPKRFRATQIIVMFTGITFGGAIPGAVSAWLVPTHGWQILFTIGGIVPIVIAIAVAIGMPESIKFLVVKGRNAEVTKLLRQMTPNLTIPPNAQFVIRDEKQHTGFSPKYLFMDGLQFITPLLWICFIVNLMGFYFLMSWMPTLLSGANIPVSEAALATSLFQIGGTVGGLALARPLDTRGLAPVTLLFALAIPIIGSIGYVGLHSEALLMLVVFLGGFCVLGLQFGLNATSAMIYPTSFRSNGSGWAFAVGRVGSIAGPVIGGILISNHHTLQQLYLWATVPFIIGTIACFILMRLYYVRFHGYGLERRDALAEARHT